MSWYLYWVSRIFVRWFSRYYRDSYVYRVNERRACALLQQPATTSPMFSPTRRRSRTCSVIAQCGTEAAVSGSRRRLAMWRPTASDTRYVGQTMCNARAHLFSNIGKYYSCPPPPLQRPKSVKSSGLQTTSNEMERLASFWCANTELPHRFWKKKNYCLVLLVSRKAF